MYKYKALVQIPRTPVNPNAVAVAGIYDPRAPVVSWKVREKSLKGQGFGKDSSKQQKSDPESIKVEGRNSFPSLSSTHTHTHTRGRETERGGKRDFNIFSCPLCL